MVRWTNQLTKHGLRCAIAASLGLAVAAITPARAEDRTPEDFFQVVFDMTPLSAPGFAQGFGYAVVVRYDSQTVLFDTGADPEVLAKNLKTAGVALAEIDAVVVSHRDHDHAGGLSLIRKTRPDLKVISAPGDRLDGGPVAPLDDHVKLSPNVHLIRTHVDKPAMGITDELSLIVTTAKSPYLFTACSHTGLPRIVDKAMAVTNDEIFFQTGGTMYKFRSKENTKRVAAHLKKRKVAQVSPGHCGIDHGAMQLLEDSWGENYVASKLGARIAMPPPPADD